MPVPGRTLTALTSRGAQGALPLDDEAPAALGQQAGLLLLHGSAHSNSGGQSADGREGRGGMSNELKQNFQLLLL